MEKNNTVFAPSVFEFTGGSNGGIETFTTFCNKTSPQNDLHIIQSRYREPISLVFNQEEENDSIETMNM